MLYDNEKLSFYGYETYTHFLTMVVLYFYYFINFFEKYISVNQFIILIDYRFTSIEICVIDDKPYRY